MHLSAVTNQVVRPGSATANEQMVKKGYMFGSLGALF